MVGRQNTHRDLLSHLSSLVGQGMVGRQNTQGFVTQNTDSLVGQGMVGRQNSVPVCHTSR